MSSKSQTQSNGKQPEMPHAPEAEKGVLASLVMAPPEVSRLCALANLGAAQFCVCANGIIFDAIISLIIEGKTPDFIMLTQRLRDMGKLDHIGGPTAVNELFTYLPTAATADHYIETVIATARRRQLISIGAALERGGHDGTADLEKLSGEAHSALAEVARQGTKGEAILQRLSAVVFDAENPPPDEPAIFTVAGIEMCHAGNLTVIEAHVKAGKSAITSAGIASTFAPAHVDCLGWQSDGNPQGRTVLHFDTEQSRGDHHRLIIRALSRAGVSVPPPWLKSYSLTGWSCAEMRQAIEATSKRDAVHSIWIDGFADLVRSPNDEEEAIAFVRWLQMLAIERGCPIIGNLHLNPGESGKSRGHLGSELNRKAETILRLTKNDAEISTVASKWTRHAPIPTAKAPRFQWSDEFGRHVSVLTAGDVKQEAEFVAARKIVEAVWKGKPTGLFRYEELLTEVMRYTAKSEATAKRKIGLILQMNLVEKALGGMGYILTAKGSRCCEPDQEA